MTDKTMTDVAVNALEGLSKVAPQVWESAVQQQVAQGWLGLAGIAIATALWLVALRVAHTKGLLYRRDSYGLDGTAGAAWCVILVGAMILLPVLLIEAPNCALRIKNPEYHAIRELLGAAK